MLPPIQVEAGRARRADARHRHARCGSTAPQLRASCRPPPADALITAPGVELIRTGPWASRVSLRGLSGERVLLHGGRRAAQLGPRPRRAQLAGRRRPARSRSTCRRVRRAPQYGSDAIGGVVNLVTHRNLLTPVPAAVLTLGLRGHGSGRRTIASTARLAYTAPNLGAEIAGGLSRLDGLSTPDGLVPNSASHDEDLAGRVVARLGIATARLRAHAPRRARRRPAGVQHRPRRARRLPAAGPRRDRLELIARPADGRQELRLLGSDQRFRTDFDEAAVDRRVSCAADWWRSRPRAPPISSHTRAALGAADRGGSARAARCGSAASTATRRPAVRATRDVIVIQRGGRRDVGHAGERPRTCRPRRATCWSGAAANAVTLGGSAHRDRARATTGCTRAPTRRRSSCDAGARRDRPALERRGRRLAAASGRSSRTAASRPASARRTSRSATTTATSTAACACSATPTWCPRRSMTVRGWACARRRPTAGRRASRSTAPRSTTTSRSSTSVSST